MPIPKSTFFWNLLVCVVVVGGGGGAAAAGAGVAVCYGAGMGDKSVDGLLSVLCCCRHVALCDESGRAQLMSHAPKQSHKGSCHR